MGFFVATYRGDSQQDMGVATCSPGQGSPEGGRSDIRSQWRFEEQGLGVNPAFGPWR